MDPFLLVVIKDSDQCIVCAAQPQEALALSPFRRGWPERRQTCCSAPSSLPRPRSGGRMTPSALPQSSAGERLLLAQLPRQAPFPGKTDSFT